METVPSEPIKTQGERWLELLGYDHLKGQLTGHVIDGQPIPVERFHELCGKHARPVFLALERLSPDDPEYQAYVDAARAMFNVHFIPPAT